MQYFEHSSTASSDDKIIALRLEHGGAAVDAYWVIIEHIYREESELVFFGNRYANLSLCHRLNTTPDALETWIASMLDIGLLERDVENPNALVSVRAMENIAAYREKCETARQNGKKGGRKPTQKPDASQTLSDGLANKLKQNKTKQINKEEPRIATAVEAAPLQRELVPHCPLCDVKLFKNTQTGKLDCPNCFDNFEHNQARWKR